jgi:hypothetical protein
MSLIVTVVIASLLGSFFCSLCEASLYGDTPTQVELLRRRRVWGSERLTKLRRRIDEPIAGIAAFNSLAQTDGAAWTGARVIADSAAQGGTILPDELRWVENHD